MLQILVDHGADINGVGTTDKASALGIAVSIGKERYPDKWVSVVRFLLERGAILSMFADDSSDGIRVVAYQFYEVVEEL